MFNRRIDSQKKTLDSLRKPPNEKITTDDYEDVYGNQKENIEGENVFINSNNLKEIPLQQEKNTIDNHIRLIKDLQRIISNLELQKKNLEETIIEDQNNITKLSENLKTLQTEYESLKNSIGTFIVNEDLRNNLETRMKQMMSEQINNSDNNVKSEIEILSKRLDIIKDLKQKILNTKEKEEKQKLEYELIKEELNQDLRIKRIEIELIKNQIKRNQLEEDRLKNINIEFRENVLTLKTYIEKLNNNLQEYRNSQNVQEQKVSDDSP